MNNEFYEHKKSDKVKWVIAFLLIIVLLAGLGCAWAYILNPPAKEETDKQEEQEAFSPAIRLYAETNSPTEITLTAIITPEDAEDKSVDWSAEWQTPDEGFAAGKTVTEYVTVTPTSDGALTAKVKCLQPFEGYIDIRVTTRDGNFTATATAVFKGKPGSMNIEVNGVSQSGGIYSLKSLTTYTFDLTLGNEWGQVGEEFYDFETSITGYGTFVVQDKRKDSYNEEYRWTGEESTFNANDWKTSFLSASITAENKLQIRALRTVNNFGSEQVIAGGGRIVSDAYKSGGEDVYFEVKVSGPEGLSQTVKVKIVSSVTNVSLDQSGVVF